MYIEPVFQNIFYNAITRRALDEVNEVYCTLRDKIERTHSALERLGIETCHALEM